jgi:TrmH family RNA methyltransferase
MHTRNGRTASGGFLVEGPHAVEAAVSGTVGHRVREAFVTAEFAERSVGLLDRITAADAAIHQVTDRVMQRLADTVTPQGIVAVVSRRPTDLDVVLAGTPRLIAVLIGVSDPGNAGTVIRSADALGADAVLVTNESADVYAGKVVRASAGALFHLPVVTDLDAEAVTTQLRAAGMQVLAATGSGTEDLDQLIDSGSLRQPTAWLFGNEAHGLADRLTAAADHAVRIKMAGRAESLNLAAAAAVCLFASSRAHRGEVIT